MPSNYWYAVEFSSEIVDRPKALKILDRELVLFRTSDGKVRAMDDTCIHRGAALAKGSVVDDCIVCPYHGWHYQADGTCVKIPSQLAPAKIPSQAKMTTYPCREEYGWIWLYLGEEGMETSVPIPFVAQFGDASLRSIQGDCHWNANYERVLENVLDFAHAPFVHGKAFGNPDAPEVGNLVMENYAGGASATVMLKANPPKGLWGLLAKKEQPDIQTRTGFHLPNLTFLEVNLPFGKLIIWVAHVPTGDQTTISKWINYRTFFRGKWADKDAFNRTMKIFDQDKPIVESQRPQIIPIDNNTELHVAADALQLQYRKLR